MARKEILKKKLNEYFRQNNVSEYDQDLFMEELNNIADFLINLSLSKR